MLRQSEYRIILCLMGLVLLLAVTVAMVLGASMVFGVGLVSLDVLLLGSAVFLFVDCTLFWRLIVYMNHVASNGEKPDATFIQGLRQFRSTVRSFIEHLEQSGKLSATDRWQLITCAVMIIAYFRLIDFHFMPYINVVWRCTIAAGVSAALLSRIASKNRYYFALGFGILIALTAACLGWVGHNPGHDEMEHLHATWMLSQGKLPFVGFWQQHSPALYIMLAPIIGKWPQDGSICDFAHLFSLAVFAAVSAMAIVLARSVHKPSRGLIPVMLLLMAACFNAGDFFEFRPDIMGNLLVMGAVLLLLSPRETKRIALSGVLLGIAATFSPKHAFFLILYPIVMIFEKISLREKARLAAYYCTGALIGVLPFAFWLSAHGILGQFKYWVIDFNKLVNVKIRGSGHHASDVSISEAIIGLFMVRQSDPWGFEVLIVLGMVWRYLTTKDLLSYKIRLLITSIILSIATLCLYKGTSKWIYHLQMWMVLTAVLGSEALRSMLANSGRSWKGAIAGVVAVGFLLTFMASYSVKSVEGFHDNYYFNTRERVGILNTLSEGQTVLCIVPDHPIFKNDATALYQCWQLEHYLGIKSVADLFRNVDAQIATNRPTVMAGMDITTCRWHDPRAASHSFAFWLATYQPMPADRTKHLQAYILSHYQPVFVDGADIWVRNDLVPRAKELASHHGPKYAWPLTTDLLERVSKSRQHWDRCPRPI